ncbi:MAG TPA: hypothetical protein VGI10_31430 [Polyangiaceae bacterium]|jgi:hypothetical protein
MTLKIYPVVLELVRRLAPVLPRLKARSASLADQFERALDPELLALFQRVIGTLVRLVEPRN